MPNHTANNFTITGPIADIKRFIDIAKDGDTELSFNKLVPMPDELRGISSPVRIMTQAEIDEVWATWNKQKADGTLSEYQKGGPFGLGITQETSDRLIEKYGTNDWYEWAVKNWGTKWDCYDVTSWDITENGDNSSATIYYQTAWSPVTNAWERISKNYPSLEFFHEFADEGGGFVGNQLIQNGDIVEDNDYEWDSDEGIVIREAVGMWVEEDEEEVEN
jgi:hypothetical protein